MAEPDARLEAALKQLANSSRDLRPAWPDVLQRAQRARRHRAAIGALGALCAVGLASSALAVVPKLLRADALAFMRSVHLPETDVPPTVRTVFAEHRFAGTPRRALVVGSSHRRITLWVSSHRGGGWCEGLQYPRARFWRMSVTCHWWRPEFGAFEGSYAGPTLYSGRAAVGGGRELRLRLEDGASVPIPTRNGFYAFRPPLDFVLQAPPRALEIRDGNKLVARQRLFNPYDGTLSPALLSGGIRRPGGVDARRARAIVRRPTVAGEARVFIAPSRLRPSTCNWLEIGKASFGGGCRRAGRTTGTHWRISAQRLRVRGLDVNLIWGHVGRRYRTLELRHQDGRLARIRLRDGYFLHVVRPGEWRRGHRPMLLLAKDAAGHVRRREPLFVFAWAR